MAGIGSVVSLARTAVSATGTLAAGRSRRRAAHHDAARADIRAGFEQASAQGEALALARERRRALSRIQAVEAASGFSASDPTALRLAADRDLEGRHAERRVRSAGIARAADLRAGAQAQRADGRAASRAAGFGAARTILGGFTSLFDRYG